MKTDKLFYRLFLSQPSLIHELIPTIPPDCDFEYTAPVIKDTEFRLDGLLTPISDNPDLPLIFLECQMQRDTEFYGRYFAEIFLYLYQYNIQRPWYGLLILPNRSQDLGSEIPYELLLNNQVKRFYLEDLLGVENLTPNLSLLKLFIVTGEEAIDVAYSLITQTETEIEFEQRFNLIEAILKSKFPYLTQEEILAMFDLKTATVPEEPQLYKEFVKRLQGRAKEEGIQQGESEMVIRVLKRRFGDLSNVLESQVRSLSLSQLESLGDALLDFQAISDLESWLTQSGLSDKT